MDKRVERTRRAIFSAYVELSSKKRKFTIKEICDAAGINKSTFYRNFNDLEDLQSKIIQNVSEYIIINFKDIDLLYSDTKKYLISFSNLLLDVVTKMKLDIQVSKISELVVLLLQKFKEYYENHNYTNYNYDRAVFVTGGVIAYLERNGDILISGAVKDLLANIDFVSKYVTSILHY